MHLLVIILLLAAMLHLPLCQGGKGIALDLSEKQQKEIIDLYNTVRREVNPPASNMLKMTWSEKAEENAKQWAQQCTASASPLSERMVDGTQCGESISQTNFASPWSQIIGLWNSSSVNFEYGKNAMKAEERNFLGYTQMVWYNSHKVGCAFVYCEGNKFPYVYICRYCPIGNIVEQLPKPYKKGPSCGDCPNNCEKKLCTNPCKYSNIYPDCEKMIKDHGCKYGKIPENCKASCQCKTEIV